MVLAAALDDVPLDDAPPDDVLLLLDPQPAASTAITATASATPTVVRKCVLDTTFSSPTVELCAPYPKTETGVKFEFVRMRLFPTPKSKPTSSSASSRATGGWDGKRELSKR